MLRIFTLSLIVLILISCRGEKKNPPQTTIKQEDQTSEPANRPQAEDNQPQTAEPTKETTREVKTIADVKSEIPDSWIELTSEEGFTVDIRYATPNNFTKKKIYDCGRCYLRPEAAEALTIIQNELKQKYGYSIKVFDCFRPRPYQQRLWDAVPDPDYVTPPAKGSMHSRGLAVDLTIVDKNGKELDMGTEYDFFGEEAHQDYNNLKPEVAKNRQLLKSTMERHGFNSIRTEWWHYSYGQKSYPLDGWVWPCRQHQ